MCANFQRELEVVLESKGMESVTMLEFPSKCHKPPAGLSVLFRDFLNVAKREYSAIHVFRSACGVGAENQGLISAGCFLHNEGLCFYMLAERKVVDPLLHGGAYLLSPGWLSKWKYYMDDWGMEQGMAREFFAESARKLVLLDTLVDQASLSHLAEFSDFIGRPSELIPVGLDFFRDYICARLR